METEEQEKKAKTPISERFVKFADYIKQTRPATISSDKKFFSSIGIKGKATPTTMQLIKAGRQDITIQMLMGVLEFYGPQWAGWIASGLGELEDIAATDVNNIRASGIDFNDVRERVMASVKEIITKKGYKDLTVFCDQEGLVYTTFMSYKDGDSTRPPDPVSKVLLKHGYNPKYIYEGRGEKFLTHQTELQVKLDECIRAVERSKEIIRDKEKVIQAQAENLSDLRELLRGRKGK